MGRHLERNDSGIGFEGHFPGCMWGILHILDYHHWQSVRKIPLRRKHGRGKHALCCRNPKTVSFDHYNDDVQEYLDAEAVPLLVEEETTKTTPVNRISCKAHIKALIAREMSARLQLQRADSIHHLEPSDHCLGRKSTEWTNPIIILHKSADASEELAAHNKYRLCDTVNAQDYLKKNQSSEKYTSLSEKCDKLVNASLNQSLSGAKHLNREVSCPQFREGVDALEIFKVNKKLFLEILHDPDVQAAKYFHLQQSSNTKLRLKKSGSFPAADSSGIRFLRPTTLEHKQKEVWSFPKGEKLPTGAQAPKSVAFTALEDSDEKSMDLEGGDTEGSAGTQETNFSSFASSQGLNKHGWHLSFISHFKDIKRKIKHALKESKKVTNHRSMNAVQHRVPSESKFSTDENEMSERLKENTIPQDGTENPRNCHETDGDNGLSKGGLSHMREASSQNGSSDRYAQLFENSFSREAEWHEYQSKSMKLSNEDKFPSSGYSLKSFTRRLSLPDLESFCPFPNEASRDVLFSKMPIRTVMDSDTNAETDGHIDWTSGSIPVASKKFEQQDAAEETNEYSDGVMVGIDEGIDKRGEVYQNIVVPENEEHSSHQDEEIGSTINFSREHEKKSPVSVLQTHFQNDLTGPTKFLVSEGSELDCRNICVDKPDSLADLQDRSGRDSLSGFCSSAKHENVGNANTMVDSHLCHFESNRLDDADFNYVRDVLEVSGFIEQDYLGTWYSLDQPLNPTLFKELEAYLHCDLEYSSEYIGSDCDHQLLFDLINEELLEIYESSLAYFPKQFSFTQCIRPLPKGNQVLEEVCKRISLHQSSRSELEQSLDDILVRDLAKGDGWMDLHLDVEDVALDMEDLIFDKLLDEVLCL